MYTQEERPQPKIVYYSNTNRPPRQRLDCSKEHITRDELHEELPDLIAQFRQGRIQMQQGKYDFQIDPRLSDEQKKDIINNQKFDRLPAGRRAGANLAEMHNDMRNEATSAAIDNAISQHLSSESQNEKTKKKILADFQKQSEQKKTPSPDGAQAGRSSEPAAS